MGEIAEACLDGDRRDGLPREQRIAQHAMRTGQALVEQEPQERRSVALEQHLHVARGEALARREPRQRKFVAVQAVEDFRFDRIEARGAHASAIRDRGGVACRPKRKRDEILDMMDHEAAQFGGRQALLIVEEAELARQQLQSFAVARDRPHECVFEPRNEKREPRSREGCQRASVP